MTRIFPRRTVLLLLFVATGAAAEHKPDAPWSWHILSGGSDESRISIYRRDALIGIYNFACDMTDATQGTQRKNGATINLVEPDSHPLGLLVTSCNVGAHSQLLTIIDLSSKANRPVFSQSGSYFVAWELQDGELWISYDQPCETGPTVECPDGYETLFVKYP